MSARLVPLVLISALAASTLAENDDPAAMLEKGVALYFEALSLSSGSGPEPGAPERAKLARAEALLRKVREHGDATKAERSRGHFFLYASIGRQGRHAEAAKEAALWVEAYPDDPSRHYTLYFVGVYHQRAGDLAAAKKAFETVVREKPGSDLAGQAKSYLDRLAGKPAAAPPKPAEPVETSPELNALLPVGKGEPGSYVVVRTALSPENEEHAGFAAVAARAAEFHDGKLIDFDGKDFPALERALRARDPENVLFVVPPPALDIVLHRRILLLSTRLDDDPFPDFSFGYLTARDAKALAALWGRTERLHEKGLADRTWISTGVTGAATCQEHPGRIPEVAKAAGFSGTTLYFAFPATDGKAWDFIGANLPRFEKASVVTMTGNGDPEGIWLFDGGRNAERDKHWPFDPSKVGHDPKNEMPRITPDRFRALSLASPIVWSGTCHSGAVGRVFVEGDIVSTFGRTDRTTVYRMPPERSLCLAILDAGAAAFLCPLGANHGYRVSVETEFALVHGASLGETIKSTWDDVCLAAAADGGLRLDIPVEGEPHERGEPIMQGGGANRILIGDPALRPFTATSHPDEKVEVVNRTKGGFDVVVTWEKGFHYSAWDMFGTDRARDWRVPARVPLGDLVPDDRPVTLTARLVATGIGGARLPYVLTRVETEIHHGRRFLHLKANAPRDKVRGQGVRAVFSVSFR